VLGTIRDIETISFAIAIVKLCFAISIAALLCANANACKTTIISGFYIQGVLPVCGNSQVLSSIIECVAVNVVNNHSSRRIGNETRKRYEPWRTGAEKNGRITISISGKTQADYTFGIFAALSRANIENLIINIRVNFDRPACNRESQKIGCALCGHRKISEKLKVKDIEKGDLISFRIYGLSFTVSWEL
jgi:hypothetical protein